MDVAGLPVLGVSPEGDHLAPPSAVDHLCSLLTGARLTRRHLAETDNGRPLGHFRWARSPEHVVSLIMQWLEDGA